MRYTSTFLLITMLLLTVWSCNTTKYTTDNLPEKQLYFGSGGGFTGAINEYMLLDNGQLFKHDSGEYSELPKAKRKKAEKLFTAYFDLELDKLQFRHPGNIYYYLRMKDKEEEYFSSWGDPSYLPDSSTVAFYKELTELIQQKEK